MTSLQKISNFYYVAKKLINMWKKLLGLGSFSLIGLSSAYSFSKESGFVSFPANMPIEDRYVIDSIGKERLAAVFDGHGGWQVSEFLHKNIKSKLETLRKTSNNDWVQIIGKAFDELEDELIASVRNSYQLGFSNVASVGSCAIVALVLDDKLIVANSGDCQAVLVSLENQTIKGENICDIHSSNLKSEQERLAKEHPFEEDIIRCKSPTACYVKGRLMPSRAFGDLHLKVQRVQQPRKIHKSPWFFQIPHRKLHRSIHYSQARYKSSINNPFNQIPYTCF